MRDCDDLCVDSHGVHGRRNIEDGKRGDTIRVCSWRGTAPLTRGRGRKDVPRLGFSDEVCTGAHATRLNGLHRLWILRQENPLPGPRGHFSVAEPSQSHACQ